MRVKCHALRAVSSHACPCHHLFTCFPVEGHIFCRFQTIPVTGTWLSCIVLKIQVASHDHIIAQKRKSNNRPSDLKYFPRQFGASGKPVRGGVGKGDVDGSRSVYFKIRERLINQMKTMTF